jgi:hypothetical protein
MAGEDRRSIAIGELLRLFGLIDAERQLVQKIK